MAGTFVTVINFSLMDNTERKLYNLSLRLKNNTHSKIRSTL